MREKGRKKERKTGRDKERERAAHERKRKKKVMRLPKFFLLLFFHSTVMALSLVIALGDCTVRFFGFP